MSHYSASFSTTLRVHLVDSPGAFADLARAIADAGGLLGAIDLVRVEPGAKVRDVTVLATDAAHADAIVGACSALPGIEVEHASDRTFLLHLGGKIHMECERAGEDARRPLDGVHARRRPRLQRDRRRPGQRVEPDDEAEHRRCRHRRDRRPRARRHRPGGGAAGDGGEGAALQGVRRRRRLADLSRTKDPDAIVAAVEAIAPGFGGINLEDISAPRCFEIEARLRERLDIPVFHDDQHGTAVVVLAAFLNALRVVGKRVEDVKVVVTGIGAAGIAVTRTLQAAGVQRVVGCDSKGVVHAGRDDLTDVKRRYAEETAPAERGGADEALAGADVYIGLSQPGAVSVEGIRSMADDAIVFAMANPTPEIAPEEIAGLAAVVATGRSDYPNQINNVLAFPGIFRGALDVRARAITEAMEVAAGHAIAATIAEGELSADYIVPSVFNRDVVASVAAAVAAAAERDGVARRSREAEAV